MCAAWPSRGDDDLLAGNRRCTWRTGRASQGPCQVSGAPGVPWPCRPPAPTFAGRVAGGRRARVRRTDRSPPSPNALAALQRERASDRLGDELQPHAELREGEIDAFSLVRAVDYPRDDAGELAGIIHPELQGRDFEPIHRGDPAFLALDGETAIPWVPKRTHEQASVPRGAEEEEEDQLYPFFINEAAYYEKGTAFMLANRFRRKLTMAPVD